MAPSEPQLRPPEDDGLTPARGPPTTQPRASSPRKASPATRARELQALHVEELQARNRLKVDASSGALLLMRRFANDVRTTP
jgi:hypothetical protein